ncbi:MAG: protein phosphatase 2C domain-containing protein [Nocardiopsaceae bacterium]|nr:protein phosphatase 2C domain-containing protein [Nocardiopsaceae bacterium]
MRICYASEQGCGAANEDRAAAGTGWAFVLDGATAPAGVDSGCRHGVSWMVDRLAAALAAELGAGHGAPLADVLAAAIERTCDAHRGTCDLGNPDSPSATAAVARASGHGVDYLVLADSAVLLPGTGASATAITDDRLDHLPGGRPYSRELVRSSRNTPGGFWVASTSAEAARQAVTGTVRTGDRRFALLTDGCTRLVDYYSSTWSEVWSHLWEKGPESLIARVRGQEDERGVPHGKRHDDATALVGEFGPECVHERPPRFRGPPPRR